MIDDAKLKSIEQLAIRRKNNNNDEMLYAYYVSALKPEVSIEIIRLARRYLALRSEGVRIGASKLWIVGNDIDAAADRLLEGYSSQAQNEV